MRLLKLKQFWLIFLIPLAMGGLRLLSLFPGLVEIYYSRGIYRFLSGIFGRIVSLVPFSITGLAIVGFVLSIFFRILYRRRQRKRAPVKIHKTHWQPDFARFFATVIAICSCLYFIFAVFCGPNYQRLTFAQQSGLDVRPSSVEELTLLCRSLTDNVNTLREGLEEDGDGVMALSRSYYQTAKTAQRLYPLVSVDYPVLSGYVARPKPTVFSRPMSYLNITGIYIATIFEPNVNVDVVDYSIPATMMHEMSHFKGYMREDEANFLAYLTCRYSGDREFMYSGAMMAFIHSTNALYRADRDAYWEVMETVSDAVWADLDANNRYWRQFEGPVADVSTAVNDVYLKSNLQQSGVKSYGEMVDLLLAEYRSRNQ